MGRNFANKVLNASKLVINFYKRYGEARPEKIEFDEMDYWIKREFDRMLLAVNADLENFHFNEATRKLYGFFWDVFCKWYLELVKHRIYGNYENKHGAITTLVEILEKFLIMLHPIMPFLTEVIYQNLVPKKKSIMLESWPQAVFSQEKLAEKEGYWFVVNFVTAVRTLRSELNVKPSEKRVLQVIASEDIFAKLTQHEDVILKLCRLERVEKVSAKPHPAASGVVEGVELYLPMNEEERKRELARLDKEIKKREKELEKVKKKLSNQNFLAKAPENVIEKQKKLREELEKELVVLKNSKTNLL